MSGAACRSWAFEFEGGVGKRSIRTLAAIEDRVWISNIACTYLVLLLLRRQSRELTLGRSKKLMTDCSMLRLYQVHVLAQGFER